MKLAILWESLGPYHFARLAALRNVIGWDRLVPIELSPENLTYAWRVEDRKAFQIHSLFPKSNSEDVPLAAFVFKIRALLKSEEVQVLFVPSYWPAYSILAAFVARSLGIRVVFMGDSHYASGTNTGLAIFIKRFLLRFYDSAFVAGSLHRSFLRHLGMPAERISDGYDTVDNDHFIRESDRAREDVDALRQRLGLPSRYILSLGRFVGKKNLGVLIRAYGSLVKSGRHHDHHLVLVGAGPDRDALLRICYEEGLTIIQHNGLPGEASEISAERVAVHFYPFAQIDSVPFFYGLATTFVLASATDEWGLVVNEAMASGCPVVVSRTVGSSVDLVLPGKTGYRFVPENRHELEWCLESLCSDLGRAREMGLNARDHIGAWSNARFVRGALRAARVALGERIVTEQGVDDVGTAAADPADTSVWFLQTCFPDYRVPVFNQLVERLGGRFHLFTGTSYFTPDIKTNPDYLHWHSLVENRFLGGRRFLWQRGACERMLQADVAVMELNPRIFSNWVILAARALWGAPTLLWGHAWGREDAHSVRNVLRLYMMRLASATITYTRSQRDEVRSVFPAFKVFAATNSLIRAKDCSPASISFTELDTVLYVGRLNAPKKPKLLVEGFLRARLPVHMHLKLVGDGSVRAEIDELIRTRGVMDRVQLLGHVHNHDILRDLYARSICAVSPGYVGLGAIQSFSFGVPLVLADKEPHAPEVEACAEGENTVYFSADNADDLARVLEQMWEQRQLWLNKREGLARWTAKNYSVEAMVDGFVEAINAVAPGQCPFGATPVAQPAI